MERIVSCVNKKCSCCGQEADRKNQRYCRSCHNAYQRANRPLYKDFSAVEKWKTTSRSIANVYQRRGKIRKQPCEFCESEINVEKHHEDYDSPLVVHWLCRACHKEMHMENDSYV